MRNHLLNLKWKIHACLFLLFIQSKVCLTSYLLVIQSKVCLSAFPYFSFSLWLHLEMDEKTEGWHRSCPSERWAGCESPRPRGSPAGRRSGRAPPCTAGRPSRAPDPDYTRILLKIKKLFHLSKLSFVILKRNLADFSCISGVKLWNERMKISLLVRAQKQDFKCNPSLKVRSGRWYLVEWLEPPIANAKVATVPGSISAFSDASELTVLNSQCWRPEWLGLNLSDNKSVRYFRSTLILMKNHHTYTGNIHYFWFQIKLPSKLNCP